VDDLPGRIGISLRCGNSNVPEPALTFEALSSYSKILKNADEFKNFYRVSRLDCQSTGERSPMVIRLLWLEDLFRKKGEI
jgi:hypothetical protein